MRGSALAALESASQDPSDAAYGPILELMQAVDDYIPTPERAVDKPFLMPIEDVFGIKGRGTVVTGRVERGVVKPGEEIEIVGMGQRRKVVVTGVEMFQKTLDEGLAGDNVGCLLRGVERDEVQRGQVLSKPGSINPHTRFQAEVYVLGKEEGGRHTPFFPGYRPQFYIRTTDVTGSITLPENTEMVMPGDNVQMGVELITPVAIEEGLALRHPRGRPHRRRRRRHRPLPSRELFGALGAAVRRSRERWSRASRVSGSASGSKPMTTRFSTSRRARSSRRRSRPAPRWRARSRCRPGSRSSA